MEHDPAKPALDTQRSSSSGFTLIEMVIVMALIGLLLGLAVPRYFIALDNGKIRVQQQNLASIRDAIDKYYGDQGHYPETLETLVEHRYLRSVPIDPVTEKNNWTIVAPVNLPPVSDSNAEPRSELGGVYDVHSAVGAGDAK